MSGCAIETASRLVRGNMRKILTGLSLVLLFASSSGHAQTTNPPLTQSESRALIKDEQDFLNLINQFRASLHLPTLKLNDALQDSSEWHSQWMLNTGIVRHEEYGTLRYFTAPQRVKRMGYTDFAAQGENIACGNGDALSTFEQWALSPGHLLNMINPHFHEIGISRLGDGVSKCRYYWTTDFGSQEELNLDPPSVTDEAAIKKAVEAIIGVKEVK